MLHIRASTQPPAQATAAIPYTRFVSLRLRFDAIPLAQRDHVTMALLLRHADPADHAPINAWFMLHGHRIEIPISVDGAVDLPPSRALLEGNPEICTNQPRGSLTLAADLQLAVPPGPVVPLAYLQDGMRQVNDVLRIGARQIGGYMAQFLAPRVHHLTVTLAGCCAATLTLHTAAGVTVLHQSPDATIAVPDSALMPGAEGSLVSAVPLGRLDPS